ncbi:MAG: hypothetical protein MUE56_00895 [Ignavibacteria bacterium]|nr:hypothetical protein [Ignavibacteria bacterium]
MKSYKNLIALLLFISVSMTLVVGCSDDTVTPGTKYPNLTINGRITFTDTNGYYKFIDTSKGYYNVSAFAQWPPMGPSSANAKLMPKMEGGKMVADYQLLLPAKGFYTITSAYIKLPYTAGSVYGLGKYKSDTTHNPGIIYDTTNARVSLPESPGVGDINFLSWIDTTNKIYRF